MAHLGPEDPTILLPRERDPEGRRKRGTSVRVVRSFGLGGPGRSPPLGKRRSSSVRLHSSRCDGADGVRRVRGLGTRQGVTRAVCRADGRAASRRTPSGRALLGRERSARGDDARHRNAREERAAVRARSVGRRRGVAKRSEHRALRDRGACVRGARSLFNEPHTPSLRRRGSLRLPMFLPGTGKAQPLLVNSRCVASRARGAREGILERILAVLERPNLLQARRQDVTGRGARFGLGSREDGVQRAAGRLLKQGGIVEIDCDVGSSSDVRVDSVERRHFGGQGRSLAGGLRKRPRLRQNEHRRRRERNARARRLRGRILPDERGVERQSE